LRSRVRVMPTPSETGRGRRSDAWPDNKIVDVFVWLFQKLFHARPRWTKCNPSGGKKLRVCGVFVKALFRTRTGDPLLTMERRTQPVATHGNGSGLFLRFLRPRDLPLIATGCNHGLHKGSIVRCPCWLGRGG
jgi:hypothetical protein